MSLIKLFKASPEVSKTLSFFS